MEVFAPTREEEHSSSSRGNHEPVAQQSAAVGQSTAGGKRAAGGKKAAGAEKLLQKVTSWGRFG